ncbi:Mitochondrial nad transporter [Paramicrosporidium saccamoebae]|uniref:Mitochondrial nad transporter n=1 Tax=Paramicrosporidium saccamoebae TaxID=1246581 RepID=A0A2H9TNN0_9FUNG|nr:Mitochondrial nad transporter [Paramicrosporidium saccamoebae]
MDDKIWKHVVAGAAAGWMIAFVTCPLDVVKTRLQAKSVQSAQQAQSAGFVKQLGTIWKQEGLRGMYRGLGPTLVGYLPAFSIYFPTYHFCKVRLSAWRGTPAGEDAVVHMISAMTAGAAGNLSTNPLWVVRTRLMTQHVLGDRIYSGALDAFSSIWKEEGLRGFYKGATVSVVGVSHVAIQFPLYEWLKRIQVSDPADLSPLNILLASTVAKVLASTVTYPHEVIRTRLQIQRSQHSRFMGVFNVIRKTFKREGIRGFYRGLYANIVRVIPASGVTFVTYELIVKHLNVK